MTSLSQLSPLLSPHPPLEEKYEFTKDQKRRESPQGREPHPPILRPVRSPCLVGAPVLLSTVDFSPLPSPPPPDSQGQPTPCCSSAPPPSPRPAPGGNLPCPGGEQAALRTAFSRLSCCLIFKAHLCCSPRLSPWRSHRRSS